MSKILNSIVARLRSMPVPQQEQVAASTGVPQKYLRKLVYGERPNPTLKNIEPLIEYFASLDAPRRKATKPQPANSAQEHLTSKAVPRKPSKAQAGQGVA
jgi:hypothetical protein